MTANSIGDNAILDFEISGDQGSVSSALEILDYAYVDYFSGVSPDASEEDGDMSVRITTQAYSIAEEIWAALGGYGTVDVTPIYE